MKPPLIQLKDVHKRFGDNAVLNGTSMTVYQGEVTTIIGKSGGGKSVLLKHIIGLIAPDAGQILIHGKSLHDMKKAERKTLKRKFSYMFQNSALFDSMTVMENIALPLRERTAVAEGEIMKRVRDKMHQLDLHDMDGKYPPQLSGGMKKRVALARALVTDPEIVLFDEPTTGLDPIRKNAVHSMISDYQKKLGFTGVLVSHEIPDVFYISQRVAMLHEGRILFEGTPEEIRYVSDPVVQQFIHGQESRRDTLTGLATQTQGVKKFKEEMARLQRHHIAFSLIVLKVVNLDEINQRLGHAKGQSVLKDFSVKLQRHLRTTDTCSRYGLNKIMIVLPDANMDQAKMIGEKLAYEIKATETIAPEQYTGLCCSVSAGVAEAQKGSQLKNVLAAAESRQNTFYEFNIC